MQPAVEGRFSSEGALCRLSVNYVDRQPARCHSWDWKLCLLEEGEKRKGKLYLADLRRQIDLNQPSSWLITFFGHAGLPREGGLEAFSR